MVFIDEFLPYDVLGVPTKKHERHLWSEFAASLQLRKVRRVGKSIGRKFSRHDRQRVKRLCVERSRQASTAGAGRGEATAVSVPSAQGGVSAYQQEKRAKHGPAACPTRQRCPSELTPQMP